MPTESINAIVLGAGVSGLTTAHSLLSRFSESPHNAGKKLNIAIVAKHLPGDINQTEYCSPQAGANWRSFQKELNQHGKWDKVAFERFLQIARDSPESGVKRFPMRLIFGDDAEKRQRDELWFADLVG